jgi:hypothetical protein
MQPPDTGALRRISRAVDKSGCYDASFTRDCSMLPRRCGRLQAGRVDRIDQPYLEPLHAVRTISASFGWPW